MYGPLTSSGKYSQQLHPNKKVQQHERYLVNKALDNRIRNVKSTIPNSNTIFIKKIIKRKKILLPALQDLNPSYHDFFGKERTIGLAATLNPKNTKSDVKFKIQYNKDLIEHPNYQHMLGVSQVPLTNNEIEEEKRPFTTNRRGADSKTPILKGIRMRKPLPMFNESEAVILNAKCDGEKKFDSSKKGDGVLQKIRNEIKILENNEDEPTRIFTSKILQKSMVVKNNHIGDDIFKEIYEFNKNTETNKILQSNFNLAKIDDSDMIKFQDDNEDDVQ